MLEAYGRLGEIPAHDALQFVLAMKRDRINWLNLFIRKSMSLHERVGTNHLPSSWRSRTMPQQKALILLTISLSVILQLQQPGKRKHCVTQTSYKQLHDNVYASVAKARI
eukprot:scaffold49753_cov40-Prasinocladus_malaysianus.AAC.1